VFLGSSMRAFTTHDAAYRKRVEHPFLSVDPQKKRVLNIPYLGEVR